MNEELQRLFQSYKVASGPGSTVSYTKNLRKNLPIIFREFNIKSILDAPCGDLVWMSLVLQDFPSIKYFGGDIVEDLIIRHKINFENCNNRDFLHLDITEDPLPKVDLWILRDVLFHLSPTNIMKVFSNLSKCNIKLILTTTHSKNSIDYNGKKWESNFCIPDASFGLLNLFEEPYDFPEPLYRFDDSAENHPEREMCVWEKNQILKSLNLPE